MRNIAVVSNTSWSIYNFRKGLIIALIKEGYNVFAISPEDKFVTEIEALGCTFVPIFNLNARGKNPFTDIKFLIELRKVYNIYKIESAFLYTPKINIFGCLASKNVSIFNTINGLGTMFVAPQNLLTQIIKRLYKSALKKSSCIFFQNKDDLDFFKSQKILPTNLDIKIVNGSGINLEEFKIKKTFNRGEHLKFLFAGRLIKSKGVVEFFKAAASLKNKYPNVEFWVAGTVPEGKDSIEKYVMDDYIRNGSIKYLGHCENMNEVMECADVVTFPSYYREGIPKVLIEACAKAMPIITTNSVGCKETVDHGINGYLVNPKDSVDLASAMEKMIQMKENNLMLMSKHSRLKAETKFQESKILKQYLAALEQNI